MICLISLLIRIEEKFKLLAELNLCDEVLSNSKEDWSIFDEITAIIDKITNETKTSINVNPLFIINKAFYRIKIFFIAL